MTTRRHFLQGTAAASMSMALPSMAQNQGEPMRLGLLTVKTGPLASGGIDMERALVMYLKERNNTLAGRKIELIVADTGGVPATARTKTQELVEKNRVHAIIGPNGAGKTTFVQVLLKSLGISEPDGSPTYAIVHEYRLSNGPDIYHLDCYRIENERDLAQLGLDELFEQNAFFFVEWPQKIEKILPDNAKWLYIRCAPESELREIVLTYDN